MQDTERATVFEYMADGATKMMMVLSIIDVDDEERNDLIERQTAITCQVAAVLGFHGSRPFADFVAEGVELSTKLRAKYERLMR